MLEPSAALRWAEKFRSSDGAPISREVAMASARHQAKALFYTEPDERLACMESPERNFSADHLKQANRVMDVFVGREGAARGLAARCLEERRLTRAKSRTRPGQVISREMAEIRRDHNPGEALQSGPRDSRPYDRADTSVKPAQRHNSRGRGRSSAPANYPA